GPLADGAPGDGARRPDGHGHRRLPGHRPHRRRDRPAAADRRRQVALELDAQRPDPLPDVLCLHLRGEAERRPGPAGLGRGLRAADAGDAAQRRHPPGHRPPRRRRQPGRLSGCVQNCLDRWPGGPGLGASAPATRKRVSTGQVPVGESPWPATPSGVQIILSPSRRHCWGRCERARRMAARGAATRWKFTGNPGCCSGEDGLEKGAETKATGKQRPALRRSRIFWRQLLACLLLGPVWLPVLGAVVQGLGVPGAVRLAIGLAVPLSTVAAVGLAFLLARRTVVPVRELRRAAERTAAGQHGRKVYVTGNDEIAELADAFNHMSERLAVQLAQLEEDRQQLRTILSGMVEGVVALDAEQRILFANERAAELLDFQPQAIVGRKLWEVVRHRSLQDVVLHALRGGGTVRQELTWNGPAQRT